MEKYVVLKKTDFNDFVAKLAKGRQVIAPVQKGRKSFAFAPVKSGEEVSMKYIPTILPPKKYFMPQREVIQQYNKAEKTWTPVLESEELVILGVHTCDLAGIQCLNIVCSDKPKDMNYLVRKEKIAIIGLECNDYCDQYASCALMDNHFPNGGYDLFFTEIKDVYMVHVNTLEGEKIVEDISLFFDPQGEHFKQLDQIRAKKREIFKNECKTDHKELKSLFSAAFGSPVWKDLEKRCLAW